MKRTPKKHPIRNLAALLLLAALCIGVAELFAARFEDPELYESVTEPVRAAYRSARARLDEYAARRAAEREERLRREEEQRRLLEEQRRLLEEQERERRRLEEEQALAAQLASAPTIREKLVFADPTITEFVTADGFEVLTGGNVRLTYFNQGDEAWAKKPFGPDPIGSYGCGPTALAMAVASMADASATPESVALWAGKAGYCAPRSGSNLSIVQGAAEHYGLECVSLGVPDADTLYATLSEGGLIVALMGPGHFTGKGHFILLHGVTLTGGVLVADPNSRDNSLAVWDPQLIIDELSPSRHDGAPLWRLTRPLDL
jgi:hypothetical protein